MIKRNERIEKMVAVGVLVVTALFMLNRAKYGYIYNDEPFILTLSHRLIKGDVFLYAVRESAYRQRSFFI